MTSWACVAGILRDLGYQQVSGCDARDAGRCAQRGGRRHHLADGEGGSGGLPDTLAGCEGWRSRWHCLGGTVVRAWTTLSGCLARTRPQGPGARSSPFPRHQKQGHRCGHQERCGIPARLTPPAGNRFIQVKLEDREPPPHLTPTV